MKPASMNGHTLTQSRHDCFAIWGVVSIICTFDDRYQRTQFMSRTLPISLLVLGLVAIGQAADLQFLQPAAVDVMALLPPPPALDSKEANTELEVVLNLQATRSAAEVARAKAE